MKNERERTQEDLDMLYDDIEHYSDILRRFQNLGEPLPEDETEDGLESHINAMENEAAYLEKCLEEYDDV